MVFKETKLKGAFIVEIEKKMDTRGFFARSLCQQEFARHGLRFHIVQCNISYNKKKGTLRGMHYQISPHQEAKLVSCIRGAVYDVIIDLRPDSPTYCKWCAVELNARSYKMLFVPEGFAQGFQTLKDDTTLFYQMSEFYHPESARGVRYNDPAFDIKWPVKESILSSRDQSYELFSRCKASC